MVLSAERILARCDALAAFSETPGALTRVFLSREHRQAAECVLGWMREAGMAAHMDAIGNVVGRYEGRTPGLPALVIGSHLDTVRNAGRYDGMLGVVSGIECVQALAGERTPFAIEVIGFGDEEGARFGATLLGSRAVAGTFDAATLAARDAQGTTLSQALGAFGLDPAALDRASRRAEEVLAYVELHIEQGPVLEAEGLAVGAVTAINGFSRLRANVTGLAGHAGTVPMDARRDALAAAAEMVLATERVARAQPELVATVGTIDALPGAINVIPGEVRFTLDIRSPSDDVRIAAVAAIRAELSAIAARRHVSLSLTPLQEQRATACAPRLVTLIEQAIRTEGFPVRRLPSGAGHDGMAMSALTDIAMLFIRCRGGISHHPAESVTREDVEAGARVLARFIKELAACQEK